MGPVHSAPYLMHHIAAPIAPPIVSLPMPPQQCGPGVLRHKLMLSQPASDRSGRPHWTAHCRLCAIFTLYVVHAARLRVVGATLCMQTQTHPTARKMKRFPETHVEPMRELVIHRELPHAGVSTATLHACLTVTPATTEPRRAPLARKQRCW